jgi:hypothetical protein
MKLDFEAIRSAIVTGLPVRARWKIDDTPLDYDFAVAQRGLRELSKDAVPFGDEEWFDLLIFGDFDYAEGGGAHPWLGIRKMDGAVIGLDPERQNAMFLLNSSIDGFIRTFEFLNGYLGKEKQLPDDLEVRVRDIDPNAYPRSEWRWLVDRVKNVTD